MRRTMKCFDLVALELNSVSAPSFEATEQEEEDNTYTVVGGGGGDEDTENCSPNNQPVHEYSNSSTKLRSSNKCITEQNVGQQPQTTTTSSCKLFITLTDRNINEIPLVDY